MYYSAIKTFNTLPRNVKDLANEIVPFWNALKRFLLINSFYNSEEYFNYQRYSIENNLKLVLGVLLFIAKILPTLCILC